MTSRRIVCEAAFGFGPFDTIGAGDWVELIEAGRPRIRSAQWQFGRSNEFDHFDAGTATVVLSNRDRMLDPDNVPAALVLTGNSGSYASTPDVSALDITGDIDLRADVTPNDWTPAAAAALVAKWTASGNQRSYVLQLDTAGTLTLVWSTDGSGFVTATSPSVGATDGTRLAVRATLDVNDGGGNRVIKFYTAPTMDGTWTQLGSTITTAGTTSIFSSSAILEAGAQNVGADARLTGKHHAVQVHSGIDGTVVANPRFNKQAEGVVSFTDSTGKVWTINGDASIIGTPFVDYLLPYTPVRLRSKNLDTGTFEDEFYGFVQGGWQQELAPIGAGDCRLELVDLLGVLGGYKLPHVFDHAILELDPIGYWVLDTTENNEQVEDLSGNDHDGNAVGPVTFGERQIHPGHGTSALFPSRDSVAPDFAKSYIDLGRSPLIAGTAMDAASLVITFIARSQASANFRALFVHGNGSAALYDGLQAAIDTTGKLNYQWVEDSGGINYEWPVEVVDNVGHIMFGQGGGLAVDTEVLDTTTASLTLGSTNGVGIGGHRGIHGPDGFDGWICSVALYSTALSEANRMTIHEAFHHLEGFTSDVQIGWALDRLGVPAGRRNLDVGTVVMGPADTRDRDILEFMREVTATEGGGLYVDHRDGGKIRFTNRYSRHLATRSVTSQATFTDDPSANSNVSIRYMAEGLEVAPNALDGIVNQVTVTWAGGEVVVEDTASVTANGPRGRQVDTTATTAHQARSTGEWIIANYAQPRSRVRGATASKGTFGDRHDRVQDLRIDDRVTFRVHPQKLGTATTSTLFVDGVSHVCAGPEWRTSFRFAPGHTFQPWVWGTSQWGSNPWG